MRVSLPTGATFEGEDGREFRRALCSPLERSSLLSSRRFFLFPLLRIECRPPPEGLINPCTLDLLQRFPEHKPEIFRQLSLRNPQPQTIASLMFRRESLSPYSIDFRSRVVRDKFSGNRQNRQKQTTPLFSPIHESLSRDFGFTYRAVSAASDSLDTVHAARCGHGRHFR